MKNYYYVEIMSSTNMINPANYYNPFAKYNYISKTRGVYIPRDSEPLLKNFDTSVYESKSTSIYSDNYDAEADIMESLNSEQSSEYSGIMGLIMKYLG